MARKFWINIYEDDQYAFRSKAHAKEFSRPYRKDTIHVREVTIEGEITDTMRLDFMIKEEATILTSFNLETRETLFKVSHAYAAKRGEGYFKTPREAIDAAIRSEEK